jgi:hypothetical protein
MRRLLPLLAVLLLAGCSAQSQLAGRASDYYSMLAGYPSKSKLTGFYSPAYRKVMKREALETLDNTLKFSPTEKPRYPEAKPSDIATHIEGRFALTVANPALGDLYKSQHPTKWVKAGNGWYLWIGSVAEQKAYGPFPVGMLPPKYGEKK